MAYLLSISFILFQELLQSIPSHLEKGNKYLETFTKWKGIERLVCHGNKLGTSRMLVSIHPSIHAHNPSLNKYLSSWLSMQPLCYMQGIMKVQQGSQKVKVTQSCPTLCDPMDCTVHGILQARILEWVAFPFSRGPSQPRDQTQVSHIAGRFSTSWVTREAQKGESEGTHAMNCCLCLSALSDLGGLR